MRNDIFFQIILVYLSFYWIAVDDFEHLHFIKNKDMTDIDVTAVRLMYQTRHTKNNKLMTK